MGLRHGRRTDGNRHSELGHPHLAVNRVSLADRAAISNGLSHDLDQAIGEIVVVQQSLAADAEPGSKREAQNGSA
jgi:hypothetical protein